MKTQYEYERFQIMLVFVLSGEMLFYEIKKFNIIIYFVYLNFFG